MSDEKKPTPPTAGAGATPVACTTTGCPKAGKKSMSAAEAQAFMDDFKKTDIPFDYPPDCCYARARVMCDEMEKKGFESQKLWSEGHLAAKKANGDAVTFPDRNGAPKAVTWHYHVAPIVNVEQPDGSVSPRVLDPSLSDTPLTVDEWKARCGVKPGETMDKITPPNEDYPFDPANAGKDFPVGAANQSFTKHRASRDRNRAAAAAATPAKP